MLDTVKIELGCGLTKNPGYIGVDRFPLRGVDIVADITKTLPFDSDSTDVVLACHSLEHVNDLRFTMGEIYRICKHGAIVMILAPYCYSTTNVANPYHHIPFNESTFQFFCNYPDEVVGVDPEDYYRPHAKLWGLGKSDNSDNQIDFALVGMEFFYAKQYSHLTVEEKRSARRSLNNVCDQIYYCLVANKSNTSFTREELMMYAERALKLTPDRINQLRNRKEEPVDGLIEIIRQPLLEQFQNIQDFIKSGFENQEQIAIELKLLKEKTDTTFLELNQQKISFEKYQKQISLEITDLEEKIDSAFLKLNDQLKQFADEEQKMQKQIAQLKLQKEEQLKSSTLFLADTIRRQEKSLLSRLKLYEKSKDITEELSEKYKDFIQQVQYLSPSLSNYLAFSHILPWKTIQSYSVTSNTGRIRVLLSAMLHSIVIMEVVQYGQIVWQERIEVQSDKICNLCVGCTGVFDLRIRAVSPNDIVRILECNYRKCVLMKTTSLAYTD